jgi:uroporphyrinogen decarboxylase
MPTPAEQPDHHCNHRKALFVTKPLLSVLEGQTAAKPPFWFMRQAGRYLPEYRKIRSNVPSFLDLCYTPDLAAEVTIQPIQRFHPDAAILFSDILVIPDALGQSVRFSEGVGPELEPVTSVGELAQLSAADTNTHLAPVFETVRRVKAQLPDDVALLGFAGAPWTVATYMVEGGTSRDFAKTKLWARKDPDGFDRLLALLIAATSDYLIGQLDAGADAVQLFDTWAGAVPADQFDRCVIAPTRQIIANVRAAKPAAKFIGFPRGVGPAVAYFAAETGVDCVGIDSALSPGYAAETLQPACAVQGNLDPMALLAGGAPMFDAAAAIIEALGSGPFIFNLGHGVVPQTPPDHVEALAEFLRSGVRP